MAIQFKEIRQYLARNTRLSICFEDGCYHDYLMISDISAEKYKDLYVYGIGMVDVEFSKDIYTSPQNLDDTNSSIKIKECTFEPAIEIVLHKIPRDIKRKAEGLLLFKDIKPYLQTGVILLLLTERTGCTSYMNGKEIFLMSMMINLFSV